GMDCFVRGRRVGAKHILFPPATTNACDQRSNLPVGQLAAILLRKGRHQRSLLSFRNHLAHRLIINQRLILWIRKVRRGSILPIRSMTTGAVSRIQRGERNHIFRSRHFWPGLWFAGQIAARQRNQRKRPQSAQRKGRPHGLCCSLSRSPISPGDSTPIRTASGACCNRLILPCFVTTYPATSPKITCAAANDHQSMCCSKNGFTIPSTLCKRPVHATGARIPPSRIGCFGHIGSIAPYSNPTNRVVAP